MKEKGFTLVELLIVVAIVGIFLVTSANFILNNRSTTEKRALKLYSKYLTDSDTKAKVYLCRRFRQGRLRHLQRCHGRRRKNNLTMSYRLFCNKLVRGKPVQGGLV